MVSEFSKKTKKIHTTTIASNITKEHHGHRDALLLYTLDLPIVRLWNLVKRYNVVMDPTQTLQSARNQDEAEWKSNDLFGLNNICLSVVERDARPPIVAN